MLSDLIKTVSQKLSGANIPYMIIGGQAAILYREPRFTNDIDISLGIGEENKDTLLNLCKESGFKILVDNPSEFIVDTMVLPVLDEKSLIRIDFIFSDTQYEREAISRAVKIKIEGVDVSYCSLEDLVILKLFAGRARDIEDVEVILRKNKKYNRELILNNLIDLGRAIDIDLVERLRNVERIISKSEFD